MTGQIELRDSRDSAVRRTRDFAGIVVWLEPTNGNPPLASGHARMIQKEKRFSPHVLAIPAGTRVDFPNFDPIFHNAFSNFDAQMFDVGLYPPGSTRSVRFERPGIVRVFCNIHPAMSAVIVVLDTPYFSMSQRDGTYEIRDVPRGEYTLHVFHERATSETLQRLERRVTVSNAPLVLPAITISESGYIAIPHKNKYGKEYPPSEENPLYPGARK